MPRKSEHLKVICYLSTNGRDGPYKPVEECTEEELRYFRETASKNASKYLSEYYSARPDEYRKLLKLFSENSA